MGDFDFDWTSKPTDFHNQKFNKFNNFENSKIRYRPIIFFQIMERMKPKLKEMQEKIKNLKPPVRNQNKPKN
jgi:hypothetical protein